MTMWSGMEIGRDMEGHQTAPRLRRAIEVLAPRDMDTLRELFVP
jgi:hypothetical protein